MGWSKFWWWQLHSPRSAQECSGYLWRSECFSCFFGRWRQGVAWGCRTKQISDKGSTAGAAAACLAFASWGGPNCGCDSSRVQHLLLNVVNGNSSSRIVSPGVLVLWLWEIETLWHMVIQVLVVTARESKISSGMFSRFMPHTMLLLQFWQMEQWWPGVIPSMVVTAPQSKINSATSRF